MKQNLEIFTSCCDYLDADCDHETWVRILMACKAADDSETMREACRQWSQCGRSYNDRDFDATWDSIEPEGGITFGTVIWMAREAGWSGMGEMNDLQANGASDDHPKSVLAQAAANSAPHLIQKGKSSRWRWATLEIAERAFNALPTVQADQAAREYLAQYGLNPDLLHGGGWRVFNHPDPQKGPGIVYRGQDAGGAAGFQIQELPAK